MNKHVLSYLLLAATVFPGLLQAELPDRISYQGRLLTTQGDPVNGSRNFTVSIYSNATSGTILYSENLGATLVQDGVYAFTFGQGDPASLKQALAHPEVYLQLWVNGQAMLPRERLVTVPYAIFAESVVGTADVDRLSVTGDAVTESFPGTTNQPPYRYYPQVVSVGMSGEPSGAIVLETPIPRTARLHFALRVRGVAVGDAQGGVLDFMVWGTSAAGDGTNTVGSLDGLDGQLRNIQFADAGTDHLLKFVGISPAATNGTIALAIGTEIDNPVNYRLTVDAWIAPGTNDIRAGWSVYRSSASNAGFGDIHGPFPSNPGLAIGAYARGLDARASGEYSIALGVGSEATAYGSVVVGTYNDTSVPGIGTFWSAGDELFVVGNGFESDGAITRRNALVIRKDGRAIFHGDVEIRGGFFLSQPQGDIPMWTAP